MSNSCPLNGGMSTQSLKIQYITNNALHRISADHIIYCTCWTQGSDFHWLDEATCSQRSGAMNED